MSASHSSAPSGSSRSERSVELAAAPARPDVEQLGTRDAEQEDGRVAREVGDVLDEVDEHRLGPLQVVDHDDLRSLGGAGFEQPAKRELRLGQATCRSTESGSTPIATRISTSGQYVIPSP